MSNKIFMTTQFKDLIKKAFSAFNKRNIDKALSTTTDIVKRIVNRGRHTYKFFNPEIEGVNKYSPPRMVTKSLNVNGSGCFASCPH